MAMPTLDDLARHVVELHFHPEHGSPYWLERARRLGQSPLRDVKDFEDFRRVVGFRDAQDQRHFELATRTEPVERFIPASVLSEERWFWPTQTGGTTGDAKHGVWFDRSWQRILRFADRVLSAYGVPQDVNWLLIGPTGPHGHGRIGNTIVELRGGGCFCVDLDPRIVKVFENEGNPEAAARYIRHIWEQVRPIIRHQEIGVVYTTARLLEMIPEYLDPEDFREVHTFIHAGIAMSPDTYRILDEEIFPGALIVGLYGTSTTGPAFQAPAKSRDDHRLVYVPNAPYTLFEVVDDQRRPTPAGEAGHVISYRLTEDAMVPGFLERDRATRVAPFGAFAEHFPWDWVGDPHSPVHLREGKAEGVY